MTRRVLLLLSCGALLWAELPQQAYRKMQLEAKEDLEIEVNEVLAPPTGGSGLVSIHATVTKVNRTATGLRQGKPLRIYYRQDPPKNQPGPAAMPILEKGKRYPAFLTRNARDQYEPAALGKSFSPLFPAR